MPRSCRMTALKPEHNKTAHCRTYFIQRQDDLICATEVTKTLGNFFYLYLHRATSPATPRQIYLSQNCTSNTCWVIFILFTPCVNFTQTFAHSILFGYFLHLVKSINILGNFFTHLQLRILLAGQFYPDLFLRPILYRVIFYILCDL